MSVHLRTCIISGLPRRGADLYGCPLAEHVDGGREGGERIDDHLAGAKLEVVQVNHRIDRIEDRLTVQPAVFAEHADVQVIEKLDSVNVLANFTHNITGGGRPQPGQRIGLTHSMLDF